MKLRNWLHHAISDATIWRYRRSGMTIGEGCLISRKAKLDMTNPKGVKIGDETAVSFDVAILTHDFVNNAHVDTVIGSRCFIGARAMIMPGVTIGDSAIVGAGSVVYTDVEPNTVVAGNPARVVERGIEVREFGIKQAQALATKHETPAPDGRQSAPKLQAATDQVTGSEADLAAEFFGEAILDAPFTDSEIDSFALISIRARLETHRGSEISDAEWEKVETPRDALALLGDSAANAPVAMQASEPSPAGVPAPSTLVSGANFYKSLEIGMPQMGANGLSESWLFKELGDAHWQLICSALGVKSNAIQDADGNRLYATFTRLHLETQGALSAFKENDQLTFEGTMERFGAGMFFSRFTISTPSTSATMEMMSSFARFGTQGDNSSLTKGQPVLPADFAIPPASDMPEASIAYKKVRETKPGEPIFTTDYDIIPFHDINGVGLLYFAAYPAIHDISLARYFPQGTKLNTVSRELCYFANSGEDGTIELQLEACEHEGTRVKTLAHLVRQDGKRMATVRAQYETGGDEAGKG